MSLRATVIAIPIAVLALSGAGTLRADPPNRDQAPDALRQMIAPSPEAERAYAIALAIWQRENATPAAPEEQAPQR
jgi:hypothetical protein